MTPSKPGREQHATFAKRVLSETSRFAALQVFATILAAGANIALARLLARRDFGVYGICTFYIGLGSLLGDGGLGAALLRGRHAPTKRQLRASLTAMLAVSSALGLALIVGAPWIAARSRFTQTEMRVLYAMAPLYLVSALRLVPYLRMERELLFSNIARIELASSLARHVVAIALALAHEGVWALVLSNIVGTVMQLSLAWRAAPGWVGIGWRWRTFRPIFAYGGKVQALQVLSYFKDNISASLLGFALGPAAVGIFDFGIKYIQVPVVAVNSLARVQLPVYARLDRHDPALYDAVRGAIRTGLVLGLPLLVVLAHAAPWAVPTIYGKQWIPAYPVIWGLVANMAGGLVASPLFTLLQGQGRAGLAIGVFTGWTLSTWALAVLALVLWPGALGPIAYAHAVVTVAVVGGLLVWAGRHLGHGMLEHVLRPTIAGGFALGAGFACASSSVHVVAHPIARSAGALVTYVFVLFALEGGRLRGELRALMNSFRAGRSNATRDAEPR